MSTDNPFAVANDPFAGTMNEVQVLTTLVTTSHVHMHGHPRPHVPGLAHALMRTEANQVAVPTGALGTGTLAASGSGGGAHGVFGGLSVATHTSGEAVAATAVKSNNAMIEAVIARSKQQAMQAMGAQAGASPAYKPAKMGKPAQIGAAVMATSTPVDAAPPAAVDEAPVAYKAHEFFPQEAIKVVPFRAKFETSLADLATGRQDPTFVRDISYNSPVPLAPGQKVLVIGFEVLSKNCTSNAELGVKFGQLGKTIVSSLEGPEGPMAGLDYHTELPTIGQAINKPETVIASEMMGLNPQHLRRYAGRSNIDDLRAEIAPDKINSSIVHVPRETPVGDALSLPNFHNPKLSNAQYHSAKESTSNEGVEYFSLNAGAVEGLLKIIKENVFDKPEFHWRQTALDRFAFTLVPLTATQQFVASEMGVEDHEKQATEMNRRFTVTIRGNVHMVPVPNGGPAPK